MTDIHAQIAEMRARVDAATEGPWMNVAGIVNSPQWEVAECYTDNYPQNASENATFIAHARTDLPKLLDAVEAVVGVHRTDEGLCACHGSWQCPEADYLCVECCEPYPCPTITALADALGGGE